MTINKIIKAFDEYQARRVFGEYKGFGEGGENGNYKAFYSDIANILDDTDLIDWQKVKRLRIGYGLEP